MKRKEILETLMEFGLTEYESMAYATLSSIGPAKAARISKESGIPQSKIYEVLEKLMEKQLVEFLGGKPKEFRAVPAKVGLVNLLEREEGRIRRLYPKVEDVSKYLKPFVMKEEILEGVWTTKGKGLKDFVNRLCDMFERTKSYAYVISRDFTWSSNLAKIVKSCVKRGVTIRTIAIRGVDEKNYYRAKWYYSNGVKIKILKTSVHPRVIVTDGKEALIRLDRKPTKKTRFPFVSIYSTDRSLVKVFDTYMKNLWQIAEPVNFTQLASSVEQKSR